MRFSGFEQLLRHWAQETPDASAFLYGSDHPQSLTFRELLEKVTERRKQLERDDKSCIGILCDGSISCVTEIFAANLAGRQIVLLDPMLPPEQLAELLLYADADAVWGPNKLCAALQPALTKGISGRSRNILFFTSGTTQRAKAVILDDQKLCSSAWNGGEMLPLAKSDILLNVLPLNHVFGFVCGMLWGMSFGCTVALGRGPRYLFNDCEFYRPTAISLVPAMIAFFLQHHVLNHELRLILIGAGGCPEAHIAAARALGKQVCFGYGLTETSSGVAISTGDDPFAMAVCPDDTISLADDGEILIQAPTCMMAGYYKKPEATAEVLRNGVLYSGDLGHFDERHLLHIDGRKKEMLVLADGTKIFLPEYEAELISCLGNPELALVLRDGKPTLVWSGPGDPAAILEQIRPLMASKPRGQQITRVIITEDKLPRTATGKIKRLDLEEKVREQ